MLPKLSSIVCKACIAGSFGDIVRRPRYFCYTDPAFDHLLRGVSTILASRPRDIIDAMNANKNVMQTDLGKSQLSIVGLVLSIVLPPVGLIVSIVALSEVKKKRLSGSGKAIFGIVWGAIFTLPALIGVWLIFVTVNNKAANDIRPIASRIQAIGGKKLCDNGDSGYGGDNTQPWYEVYYQIPNNSQLTNELKQFAFESAYSLFPDTGLITELKNVADHATVTNYLPPDEPAYSAENDYLTAANTNKGTLSMTIYRDTSVPLDCGVSNYGRLQPTGSSNAIIDMRLTLPSRV